MLSQPGKKGTSPLPSPTTPVRENSFSMKSVYGLATDQVSRVYVAWLLRIVDASKNHSKRASKMSWIVC